jgi:hypothetical protein
LVTDCMMGLAITVAPDCSASLSPTLPVASDGTYCEPSVVAQRGNAVVGRFNHGNNLAISISPVAGGGTAGAFAVGVEGSFPKGNQGGPETSIRCVMSYAIVEGELLGATGSSTGAGSSMIPLPGQAVVAVQQQQQEAQARALAALQQTSKAAAGAAADAPKSLASSAGEASWVVAGTTLAGKFLRAGVAAAALIAGAVAMA